MDYVLIPGSLVALQGGWVAHIPVPGNLPNPGIKPTTPALAGEFFTSEPPRKPTDNGPLL